MSASDPLSRMLTGALPLVLEAGAVLALPASLFLLRLYRRAVLRGMSVGTGGPAAPPSLPTATPPVQTLRFAVLGDNPRRLDFGPRPAALVYLVSGAVLAALMTVLWMVATRDGEILPGKLALLFWQYLWPTVLAVMFVLAADRTTKWKLGAAYFAGWALISAYILANSPGMRWFSFPFLWLITNGLATLMLFLFTMRRIRSVGPLVLIFALLSLAGSQIALSIAGSSEANMRAAVSVGMTLGLGGHGVFWSVFALGLMIFAGAGWAVLRWLGRRYAAKRFSDESLTVDATFLLFLLLYSVSLSFEHWGWIFTFAAVFAVFKVVTAFRFRRLRKTASPRSLLLLRVFALGSRSERLFDALRAHWLRRGPISMIAGPDLVTSAVEPHEFLDFLSGKLGRAFVSSEEDLARRVAAIDRAPDPDGRFRIAEFFCRADRWQPTMRRLVAGSDAVLMDLRGFQPSNQGCAYEIGCLLETIPLDRFLFVIDRTTDRAFLETTLQQAWRRLPADSPNRSAADPAVRAVVINGPTPREIRSLVAHLVKTD